MSTTKPKQRRIKARKMTYDPGMAVACHGTVAGIGAYPVFVLPADRESVERMVEQMAQAMWIDDVGSRKTEPHWEQLVTEYPLNAIVEAFRSRARAAVASIGITAREGK